MDTSTGIDLYDEIKKRLDYAMEDALDKIALKIVELEREGVIRDEEP